MSPDHDDPNVVHDLRIMANHAAFLCHVDKSVEVLTTAMGVWFENYDTGVPFSGELYAAADTRDEQVHTSSIS